MLSSFILLSLLAFFRLAQADVSVSAPTAGASFSGSSGTASVKLSWDDDDADGDYALSNIKTYTISLCYGASTSIKCVKPALVSAQAITSKSYTASLTAASYPDGWYYFQIYAVFKDGDTTIHYSDRFELTNMSGSTASITATATGDAPAAQTQGSGDSSVNSASFTVPYTLQTGKTRYAPMQTQPGLTVTATTWTQMFPTSAVTYYTLNSPPPSIKSTVTPGWNYTAVSAINYASVAAYPTYYYPASSRISRALLKSANSKRWLD